MFPFCIGVNGSTLVLDCEAIVEQHGDSAVIRQLAQQVGYAPIFNWLNFLSSLLDLAAQGSLFHNSSDDRNNWPKSWIHRDIGYSNKEDPKHYGDSFESSCSA